MKAGKFTGKLNPFPQSKLTYGFPFRENPSTYTTLDYLTGEGRLQLLPYFYITMGVTRRRTEKPDEEEERRHRA